MAKGKQSRWLIEVLLSSEPYLSITFTTRQITEPTKKRALKRYEQLAEEQDFPRGRLILRICKLNDGE